MMSLEDGGGPSALAVPPFFLAGYTLLHCAAAWGRLETLKVLVELDVDIEALNFRGERARDVAARYSQSECVEFLDWAGEDTPGVRRLSDSSVRSSGCMSCVRQRSKVRVLF